MPETRVQRTMGMHIAGFTFKILFSSRFGCFAATFPLSASFIIHFSILITANREIQMAFIILFVFHFRSLPLSLSDSFVLISMNFWLPNLHFYFGFLFLRSKSLKRSESVFCLLSVNKLFKWFLVLSSFFSQKRAVVVRLGNSDFVSIIWF